MEKKTCNIGKKDQYKLYIYLYKRREIKINEKKCLHKTLSSDMVLKLDGNSKIDAHLWSDPRLSDQFRAFV